MKSATVKSYYKVSNVVLPPEGPVIVPVELDFSADALIDIDGYQIVASGKLSYIQSVYIDNADNANDLTLTAGLTNQRIIAPAGSQGYYPIFLGVPPHCKAETVAVADLKIKIYFANVPLMAGVWGSDAGGGGGGGLTDAELRATPVQMERAGVAYTDRSIANLSGIDELLMAANPDRSILIISNEGATPIAVNLSGGVAALNTAGNITLAAGGSITLDEGPPTGDINIIGTANADVTAFEG